MSGNVEQRLWEAIEDKDYRKARSLLRTGAQIDKLSEDGIAVIHFLSGISGDEANQLLKECLENGASPNVLSCDGITPVHVAAIWGIFDNLSTLVKYGGDVLVRDADGKSPLDYANECTECQAKHCVKLLTDLALDKKCAYTKIKSKPDSLRCTLNNRQDLKESENQNKASFFLNPSGYYYMNERDLLSEEETSAVSLDQTDKDNDFLFFDDFTHDVMKNPRQAARGSKNIPSLTNPFRRHYFDVRDLMTEDESSSDSLMSDSSSSSFLTANEGDISNAFASALDDTVVTFPKLHPWTAAQNQMALDDTIIDGINGLDIGNTSENLDSTSSNIIINNTINSTLSDGTVLYDWKEYSILEIPPSSDESDVSFVIPESLLKMECHQLKEELLKLGDNPGPIRTDTRMLYVRRLARIQSGLTDEKQSSDRLKEYLPEVRAVIEGRLLSPEMDRVEDSMCVDFTKHNLRSKWREGTEKSSFNYLLLDPRVTQNLPVRSKKMAYEDIFHTFVAAIFYVGKGKRSRPYAHLHEATNLNKANRKLQQIRDIWSAGLGVVSLHCFQGVIPVEAYTREACLVEALGLARLTNQKRCDYYGRAKAWRLKKKRQMGVSLLKRALQIFLNEGERHMRPEDLRRS